MVLSKDLGQTIESGDSGRNIRKRDLEEITTTPREVAEQALAILEAGHGVGAINEALGRLDSARQTFQARGLIDYAASFAELVEELNIALTEQNPKQKEKVIEKLRQFTSDK